MIKKCLVCGTEIAKKQSIKVKCKDGSLKIITIPHKKVHSRCFSEWKNLYRRLRRKKNLKDLKCKWCGKLFHQKNLHNDSFCSRECATNTINKRKGVNVGYRGTTHKCKLCGKEYLAYVSNQKWCSKKCRRDIDYRVNYEQKIINVHIRKARKAEGGGRFTKKEWNEKKKLFGNACADCKKSDVKLTIDHIIPISKWKEWAKMNKPNYKLCDIENLQPLCWKCNNHKRTKILK